MSCSPGTCRKVQKELGAAIAELFNPIMNDQISRNLPTLNSDLIDATLRIMAGNTSWKGTTAISGTLHSLFETSKGSLSPDEIQRNFPVVLDIMRNYGMDTSAIEVEAQTNSALKERLAHLYDVWFVCSGLAKRKGDKLYLGISSDSAPSLNINRVPVTIKSYELDESNPRLPAIVTTEEFGDDLKITLGFGNQARIQNDALSRSLKEKPLDGQDDPRTEATVLLMNAHVNWQDNEYGRGLTLQIQPKPIKTQQGESIKTQYFTYAELAQMEQELETESLRLSEKEGLDEYDARAVLLEDERFAPFANFTMSEGYLIPAQGFMRLYRVQDGKTETVGTIFANQRPRNNAAEITAKIDPRFEQDQLAAQAMPAFAKELAERNGVFRLYVDPFSCDDHPERLPEILSKLGPVVRADQAGIAPIKQVMQDGAPWMGVDLSDQVVMRDLAPGKVTQIDKERKTHPDAPIWKYVFASSSAA